MQGGGVSWDVGGAYGSREVDEVDADDDGGADDLDGDELDFAQLRELWATLPEPPWDDERAQRIFDGIMERIGMQRRKRHWLRVGVAMALPFGLLIASRLTR